MSFINDLMNSIPIFENIENPLRFTAPNTSGVYLVGSTNFNPYTKEELYFVKVGKSKNLKQRMSGYQSSNPGLFHIDFMEVPVEWLNNVETSCHEVLFNICQSRVEKCNEWVKVSREIYLTICKEGWDYFEKHMNRS